jgi:hypothetical protein
MQAQEDLMRTTPGGRLTGMLGGVDSAVVGMGLCSSPVALDIIETLT